MNKLGWALILVGGGLVVYGVVHVLSGRQAEPGDPDYDYEPEDEPELTQWEKHLLDVERQERDAHTSVHDLNDGV